MKKKMTLLTLGAALIAVPVLAAQGGGHNMGDANKDGVLTRAEVQAHATEMFAKMDANGDGKLDTADRAAKHAKMFESIDTNKDGSISKAEWDQHAADRQAKHGERMGMRGEAGEPGEGGHPGGMGGHHGKRGSHDGMGGMGGHHGMMMMKADTNGDKAVSQAEFQTAALAHFDRMDANKDGKVTAEEHKAARGEMRGKRDTPPAPPAGE